MNDTLSVPSEAALVAADEQTWNLVSLSLLV
jgi:hypothetical protein